MVRNSKPVRILRSLQFYFLTLSVYFSTAALIVLYVIVVFPLLLWDKAIVYRVTNRLLFASFKFSALFLNYAWRVVILNDFPKDRKQRGRVIMFNHLSASDPFLVAALGVREPIICTYKDAVHKLPTSKLILRLTGHLAIHFKYDKANDKKIPLKESVISVMEKCKWSVDKGLNIGVYPEGRRSRDGKLGEFKDGFFRFAVENDVEILPCALSNSDRLWPLDSKVLVGEGVAYVNIGKPIKPQGKTIEELKAETRSAIYELMKQCPSFKPETQTVTGLSDEK
ncbi:hypothetical protein BgAZ_206750 [Babesia gibsoni]|uniref:Phospholipid/glycerol acyltransferase domain-containing protein n=1 Tax=Babesia gibsoni TaxID=33632 RepID=A0AAD8PED5_BABGI|nr:hypothetical protein BgAZ_206750 [Babesia gibsoni]